MKTPSSGFREQIYEAEITPYSSLMAGAQSSAQLPNCFRPRAPKTNSQEPKYEMGTFIYACWSSLPNFSASPGLQQLFSKPLQSCERLVASARRAIAGPFATDTRIARLLVLNASSPEEPELWRRRILS